MSLNEAKEFAKWAVASGKFKNLKSPQHAMILMQYGAELGMGPATSLQSVYEVGGIPALKANTIGHLIKTVPWQGTAKNRYNYRVKEATGQKCVIDFLERNDEGQMELIGTTTYTMEDAKLAGLVKNDTYRKFPRNMLFCRALTEGARMHCPDCLGGIPAYTPDELGAQCAEDGTPVDVVDASFAVRETKAAPFEQGDGEVDTFQEPGISDEEYADILREADAKNLCLSDVIGGLGGDPNDLKGMTRRQYHAAKRLISAK